MNHSRQPRYCAAPLATHNERTVHFGICQGLLVVQLLALENEAVMTHSQRVTTHHDTSQAGSVMRRSKHAYRSCFLSMPSFSMSKDFTSSICNAPCSVMVQRQQWPCSETNARQRKHTNRTPCATNTCNTTTASLLHLPWRSRQTCSRSCAQSGSVSMSELAWHGVYGTLEPSCSPDVP